ncbi:Glucosamine-6-phosphate isomerase 1 [Loxospora ochrophaea]|nr:Glucosamine-6-phosphate isomerase 1 [Loxospora ochrophaea]
MAQLVVERISAFRPSPARPFFILGLPTGSSPELIYSYLVRFFRAGKVSFRHVVTFNMDEYVGLLRDHPQSYHSFMYTHLFSHIDIDPQNVHLLDGMAADLNAEHLTNNHPLNSYESLIASHGGIDFFLGGVGGDGHIAFNEPGSSLSSRTRVKILASSTIAANARFFNNDISQVPKQALTVGVGTIMSAREVGVIATGAGKAMAIKMGVEGPVNHMWTISALQGHPKVIMAVDEEACGELRVKTLKYFKQIENEESESEEAHAVQASGQSTLRTTQINRAKI